MRSFSDIGFGNAIFTDFPQRSCLPFQIINLEVDVDEVFSIVVPDIGANLNFTIDIKLPEYNIALKYVMWAPLIVHKLVLVSEFNRVR